MSDPYCRDDWRYDRELLDDLIEASLNGLGIICPGTVAFTQPAEMSTSMEWCADYRAALLASMERDARRYGITVERQVPNEADL